ncbi:kinase [Candidatus Parcubacteria bacterium]|jgi:D-glycero-alpha-D-manno-heptose-7-phosphate kinase|nr:MAG: kinase [Candidatus Parcubacteria bacterium]
MIITRTPYRISFFGGGSDYPGWYLKNGGQVLATTIDKFCYLTCRYLPPFFEHRIRIVYSRIESCFSIDEIQHPAVREGLRFLNIDRSVEIHHDGDLPARSGIGSSSSFVVGLLHALYALKGQMIDKHRLAKESIYLEQQILKETVGSQDQVLAAYGGLNHIHFLPNGDISVTPITVQRTRVEELNSHLMLFYTGIKRTAAQVAESYVNDIESREKQMNALQRLVGEAITILNGNNNIIGFGELLHEAWQIKRGLSEQVSNEHVDGLYNQARKMGAIGGKLLGAGGGGFILLFVPPEAQKKVIKEFSKLIYVPFQFEYAGSQIIFYDPRDNHSDLDKKRGKNLINPFQEMTVNSINQ